MQNASQRLRIIERGWKGFTGFFGGVEFKDEISVEAVDPMIAARLGSLIRIEAVDAGQQAGSAANMERAKDMQAEVVAERPRGSTESQGQPTPVEKTPAYTREQLEQIADQHGISGLRTIAEPLGIRGRSINELIDAIGAARA